jgi:uncharacterized membrane protein YdjX (TVP38/TMEM64 family)
MVILDRFPNDFALGLGQRLGRLPEAGNRPLIEGERDLDHIHTILPYSSFGIRRQFDRRRQELLSHGFWQASCRQLINSKAPSTLGRMEPAQSERDRRSFSWGPWLLLAALALALILTPFFLFEEDMNRWAGQLTRPGLPAGAIAAAVVVLLASDVLLPVPSSIVSTAAGAALGWLPGLAASAAGMTAGSLLGYALGRRFGLPLVRRIVRERDLEHVAARFRRGAGWALAALRPVPVLAEASALFAGVSRVSLPAYVAVTTLANLGISAVYCAVGARAFERGSFLLAFAASVALPGAAMGIQRLLRSDRHSR